MIKPTLLLLSLLAACGRAEVPSAPTKQPVELVKEKSGRYAELYRAAFGDRFYLEHDCDSLLFNGLICAAGKYNGLTAYRDDAGKWLFRTPKKQCFASGRSGSEISRDMLVGAMWCLWAHGKTADLERLRTFGKANDWIMGAGSVDRTYFTPNFQDTLYRLTGRDYAGPPYAWVDPIKDHQRHVVALNIILRGEHEGEITEAMRGLLAGFYAKEPHNALFAYGVNRFTDGNQAEAINILLNNNWFPADRLPTNKDRCGRWLWERSKANEAWRPCDKAANHSGGDLMFVAWLLERSKKI